MKDTRLSLNLTQDQMSDLTGISQSNLSAIEHGKYKPNRKTRAKLERILGPIDWLETGGINLQEATYFHAERLVKQLVQISLSLSHKEKYKLQQIILKYF